MMARRSILLVGAVLLAFTLGALAYFRLSIRIESPLNNATQSPRRRDPALGEAGQGDPAALGEALVTMPSNGTTRPSVAMNGTPTVGNFNQLQVLYFSSLSSASPEACLRKVYTPTFVGFVFGVWVIVDCWHHRVLYHHTLESPIEEWTDLDLSADGKHEALRIPHSVATDGEVLLIENSVGGSDGDKHSVLVYTVEKSRFRFVNEILVCPEGAARRPHRVAYDAATKAFYVYMTKPAHLVKLVRDGPSVKVAYCSGLPFMKGMYARSFALHNGSMFITAGPGVIWEVKHDSLDGVVIPIRSYPIRPLGFQKGRMNDLQFIDGWWYATSTVPCAVVRFRRLDRMHEYQRLNAPLRMCTAERPSNRKGRCFGGTPYFITGIQGRIFVPYIFQCSGVVSFQPPPDSNATQALAVTHHWDGGWMEESCDIKVRGEKW